MRFAVRFHLPVVASLAPEVKNGSRITHSLSPVTGGEGRERGITLHSSPFTCYAFTLHALHPPRSWLRALQTRYPSNRISMLRGFSPLAIASKPSMVISFRRV